MPAGSDAGASRPETRRSLVPLVFAAVAGFVAGDALRPPPDQALARAAIGAIDVYRATVSPALAGSGLARCLYQPTCSAYGREAIRRYGFPRGSVMAASRILRCHPFAKGGEDPVP